MHFLLTNDDGVHAPGIAAMIEAVKALSGASYTVVAPEVEMSSCGHRVTTHEALRVSQVDEHRYSVSGTPADCVRVALFGFGVKPDFVLSGINPGGNMGHDIHISGTAAGAREAAYHGFPSAAVSHYMVSGRKLDWSAVTVWTTEIIQELLSIPLSDGEYWNVNYPHLPSPPLALPDRVETQPCRSPMLVSFARPGPDLLQYNARYSDRPQDPGSDVATCFGGRVSVSRLHV